MGKKLIQEENPEYTSLLENADIDVMKMDGYDDCIIGILERFGMEPIIVYDKSAVIAPKHRHSSGILTIC